MIKVRSGIYRFVSEPDARSIHRGFAPGGAQDRFSFRTANRVFGNPADAGGVEFTLAPFSFEVTRECHVLIGGAPCTIQNGESSEKEWTIFEARPGRRVNVRLGSIGCRVYVCVCDGLMPNLSFAGNPISCRLGHQRIRSFPTWEPPPGVVRFLPGPEATREVTDRLQSRVWRVSEKSDGIGLRMSGLAMPLKSFDIQSAPTQDGTVQATSDGLIALLRQRGTLGGYPRIATIIDCDVDRLAQFRPGNSLRFRQVSVREAVSLSGDWQREASCDMI